METRNIFPVLSFTLLVILFILLSSEISAQLLDPKFYDVGNPTLQNIWVDPVNGNDNNDGSARNKAYLTISAAWRSMPVTPFTTGYRICLIAGNYIYRDLETNGIIGLYLDERHGTFNYPIIIESVDGPLSAKIYSAFDFRDMSYVYLLGLDFVTIPDAFGGGNTVHFADGHHILVKNCRIDGFDGAVRKPQETLKVNQVKYIYVENSEISGAFWFALDYVGVEYGHIQSCKIHDAEEDVLLLKGGTAQIRVEGNQIYNAYRFGISAGQGAGFDFMVVPWLHYEAYDLKFINNIVYNTNYAGAAVLGGYNILIAYNTFYRIGIDREGDRTLLTFNLGQRGCDGAENDTCAAHHRMGGWSPGPWSTPPLEYGAEVDCIPNRNIFVYNNIFYNPFPDSTIGNHIEIRPPYDAADQSPTFLQSSNISNPALSDDNVQIRGNIIWNGSPDKLVGIDEGTGGQPDNPTCNLEQLLRDNSFNAIEPQFVNPAALDFHPANNSNIFNASTYGIPAFIGTDRPTAPVVPLGNLVNLVPRDYSGATRTSQIVAGAFSGNSASYSIDGRLLYANSASSPIQNQKIYLLNSLGIIVDSSISSGTGNYSFSSKSPGTYRFLINCTKAWGGVNATDALLTQRYFMGLAVPDSLQRKAADVDASGAITSTDALLIARRSVGMDSSFSAGNWVFENHYVLIAAANITQNIRSLCVGDVNGTYSQIPAKYSPNISVIYKNKITIDENNRFSFPIRFSREVNLGAATLNFSYPTEILEITSITGGKAAGLIYTSQGGTIKIAWSRLAELQLSENEDFIVIKGRVKDVLNTDKIKINLDNQSELSDFEGNVVSNISVILPESGSKIPGSYELFNNYPNPFNPSTFIGYTLPYESKVKLAVYDILGRIVKILINQTEKAGSYKVEFNAANLASGIYFYSFSAKSIENNEKEFYKSCKMQLLK